MSTAANNVCLYTCSEGQCSITPLPSSSAVWHVCNMGGMCLCVLTTLHPSRITSPHHTHTHTHLHFTGYGTLTLLSPHYHLNPVPCFSQPYLFLCYYFLTLSTSRNSPHIKKNYILMHTMYTNGPLLHLYVFTVLYTAQKN